MSTMDVGLALLVLAVALNFVSQVLSILADRK